MTWTASLTHWLIIAVNNCNIQWILYDKEDCYTHTLTINKFYNFLSLLHVYNNKKECGMCMRPRICNNKRENILR